jgi:hypothetical protein
MTTAYIQSALRTLNLTQLSRNLIANQISRLTERVFIIAVRFTLNHPDEAQKILLAKKPDQAVRRVFDAERLDQTNDTLCLEPRFQNS